jgi:hypothetical protein
VYGLLVAASLRRPQAAAAPAERDLAGLPPALRRRVEAALGQEREILRQAAAVPSVPDSLAPQVEALGDDLVRAARRAADVDAYLRGLDRPAAEARLAAYRREEPASPAAARAAEALAEQLAVADELAESRRALDDELDHVETELGAIRGRLLQARVEAEQPERLTDELAALRAGVRTLTRQLEEPHGAGAE